MHAVKQGYHCILAFVIAMPGVTVVRPNMTTHPAFGQALSEAMAAGVEVWYLPCEITADSIQIKAENENIHGSGWTLPTYGDTIEACFGMEMNEEVYICSQYIYQSNRKRPVHRFGS